MEGKNEIDDDLLIPLKANLIFNSTRFDIHLDVPLGIKGIVAAIYEPPQVREVFTSETCRECNLKKWIYFRNRHVILFACCFRTAGNLLSTV